MTNIQMFPHCRPIAYGTHEYASTFASSEDAIAFAKTHGYNVIVNNNDTTQYYMGKITQVVQHGDVKFAFGKNVGRNCDCRYTHRTAHHQKDEVRGLCVDPHRLLTEVDSLFLPSVEGNKSYNSTAWRIMA